MCGDDGSDMVLRATELGLARIEDREADGTVPVPGSAETAIVAGADMRGAWRRSNLSLAMCRPASQDVTQVPPQPVVIPAVAEPANAVQAPSLAPTQPPRRNGLRRGAQALLAAWDASASADDALAEHFAALRAALTGVPARSSSADHPRPPRDTKRAQVLAMLGRPEGASGPQITEVTGWASHTVRGFLAGLGKNGMTVAVKERVRQVGPNKTGAKGGYSVYRLADEARS